VVFDRPTRKNACFFFHPRREFGTSTISNRNYQSKADFAEGILFKKDLSLPDYKRILLEVKALWLQHTMDINSISAGGTKDWLLQSHFISDYCELELELIQTQMTQKPMLRAEVGMRVRCANKASAE